MVYIGDAEYWRGYAKQMGFAKTEQAEKDYLQDLLLMELYGVEHAEWLVFRGGTAIAKLYNSGRFSEDLDFILSRAEDRAHVIQKVESGIRGMSYYYDLEHVKKDYKNMTKYTLKVNGPMYAATLNPQSRQTISMDINLFERPAFDPIKKQVVPKYTDLRPYLLTVASEKELAADKIKAIMERPRPVARDLYDLWVLVRRYGTAVDLNAAKEKLIAYPRAEPVRFTPASFDNKLLEIGKVWNDELKSLMRDVPRYEDVLRDIRTSL